MLFPQVGKPSLNSDFNAAIICNLVVGFQLFQIHLIFAEQYSNATDIVCA